MSELFDTFFGPLGKEYCVLFFALVVISLFNVFLVGYAAIRNVFDSKRKDMFKSLVIGAGATIAVFVNYLFARILYNICLKSL